uniref:shikimate O-hydroxycinnamoyltransferase-like n=1 Tax=Erigeron canadensis TaxID=72917 RepID=UPI001CB92718|nr:shikimate O-hydroxycinnamoyltransferase-like [Erigeron canadensis]
MKISVREMTMVKPTDETPRRKLWSSILDVVHPNLHTEIVYFYRSNGDANFFDTQVLKDALSRALVAFYPLGGRLKEYQNGRVEVNCQGQGALFVEAESDGVIDYFGEFAPTMELRKLIPAVDHSLPIESKPVLILQVTYFKCGGVSLGVGMFHSVVDAASMIHFINTWSEMARGLDQITIPPFIDPTLLSARNPPQPVFEHVEYKPAYSPSALKSVLLQKAPSDETTVSSIFKLTRDQLDSLKVKSKEDGNTIINYSTFELLAGHIWKCICKARGLSDDQETKLYFAIDGRARFQPSLPNGYFGNGALLGTTIPTTVAGEVKSNPSSYAASKIHDAIVIRDNNYLRSTLDYLELQPPNMKAVLFGIFQSCNSSNLAISSWAKFPLYDADFGWGRPIFVGLPWLPVEGIGFVLPSPINDGGLSLFIRLKLEHHKRFTNLFYDI